MCVSVCKYRVGVASVTSEQLFVESCWGSNELHSL